MSHTAFTPANLRSVFLTCKEHLDVPGMLGHVLPAPAVPVIVAADILAPFLRSSFFFAALPEMLDGLVAATSSPDALGPLSPALDELDVENGKGALQRDLVSKAESEWRQFVFFLGRVYAWTSEQLTAVMLFTNIDTRSGSAVDHGTLTSGRRHHDGVMLEAELRRCTINDDDEHTNDDGGSDTDDDFDDDFLLEDCGDDRRGDDGADAVHCPPSNGKVGNANGRLSDNATKQQPEEPTPPTNPGETVAPTPFLKTVSLCAASALTALVDARLRVTGVGEGDPDDEGRDTPAPCALSSHGDFRFTFAPTEEQHTDPMGTAVPFALPTGVERVTGVVLCGTAATAAALTRLPCLRSIEFSDVERNGNHGALSAAHKEASVLALLMPATLTALSFNRQTADVSDVILRRVHGDGIGARAIATAASVRKQVAADDMTDAVRLLQVGARHLDVSSPDGGSALDASRPAAVTPLAAQLTALSVEYSHTIAPPKTVLAQVVKACPRLAELSVHSDFVGTGGTNERRQQTTLQGVKDSFSTETVADEDSIVTSATAPALTSLSVTGGQMGAPADVVSFPAGFFVDAPQVSNQNGAKTSTTVESSPAETFPELTAIHHGIVDKTVALASVFKLCPQLTSLRVDSAPVTLHDVFSTPSIQRRLTVLHLGEVARQSPVWRPDSGTAAAAVSGGSWRWNGECFAHSPEVFLLACAALHPHATSFTIGFDVELPSVATLVQCGLINDEAALRFVGRELWERLATATGTSGNLTKGPTTEVLDEAPFRSAPSLPATAATAAAGVGLSAVASALGGALRPFDAMDTVCLTFVRSFRSSFLRSPSSPPSTASSMAAADPQTESDGALIRYLFSSATAVTLHCGSEHDVVKGFVGVSHIQDVLADLRESHTHEPDPVEKTQSREKQLIVTPLFPRLTRLDISNKTGASTSSRHRAVISSILQSWHQVGAAQAELVAHRALMEPGTPSMRGRRRVAEGNCLLPLLAEVAGSNFRDAPFRDLIAVRGLWNRAVAFGSDSSDYDTSDAGYDDESDQF